MAHIDIDERTLWVTQRIQQRNWLKKIGGAEPKTRTGNLRARSGRLVYGLLYTSKLIKFISGRQKIRGKDGKYWNVKILEAGKSPFPEKGGQPKRYSVMQSVKHKVSKHKFTGYNKLQFSELTMKSKRRR
uniref:Uncharacterized protein n=1 Tax=viral metagenome TaxID=1070528 RepID=A0A6M3LWB0_9ZZZZ